MHGGDRRELMNECPGCDVGEASAKALVDTQYQMLLAADAYQKLETPDENLVEIVGPIESGPGEPGVGTWGGTCACPDGQIYQVGDNGDACGSLACVGGLAGICTPWNPGGEGIRVTCGSAPDAAPVSSATSSTQTESDQALTYSGGGAIYGAWGTRLTVKGSSKFIANSATGYGSAILVEAESTTSIESSLFSENNGGAAVFSHESDVTISSSIFVHNALSGRALEQASESRVLPTDVYVLQPLSMRVYSTEFTPFEPTDTPGETIYVGGQGPGGKQLGGCELNPCQVRMSAYSVTIHTALAVICISDV